MIKRLKKKYIFIVMCAVVTVLVVIISAINVMSYSSVNSQIDEKLMMLVENEGLMPEFPKIEWPDRGEPEDNEGEEGEEEPTPEEPPTEAGEGDEAEEPEKEDDVVKEEDPRQHMSPETPFETRYFSVKFDTAGNIVAVDTSKIAAVDTVLAREYATELYDDDKVNGYLETYKYQRGTTSDGGVIYVFIDVNRELKSIRSFIVSSIVISCVGILLIFVIVVLLSETALKPIIESYEKQKRFITDAGHEMKTPLTVISANAEIIELENGESQWLSGIKNQVSKLAALTEKLVILSKMEEGAKLEMQEFSISEALYDVSDQYKSIAISAGIDFDVAVSENVTVIGNEGEIRRCIGLLLDNAFRYTNQGGYVNVSVQKLSGGAELRFANSTNGVEKGSLDRWFDRFYRTDLSRNSDTGGSGIGLSVVQAIVRAHGGSVRAFSDDGIGVVFTINL